MNILKLELARALSSRGFLAGIAGFVLCALLGVWRPLLDAVSGGGLNESGHALQCIEEALGSKYLLLALPAIAALPYAASFVEDSESRFLRSYLSRCTRHGWLAARVGATAISGGAVMAAGSGIVVLILLLVLLPAEMRPDPLMLADADAERLAAWSAIVSDILLLTASGALWALVGAAAAALTMNQHIALAAPFIFYYLLVIVSTRYFPDLEVLNPQLWAQPSGVWQDVPFAAGLQVLELCAAAGFLLTAVLERRTRNV